MVNINVRVLSNGFIFVNYQQEGKAYNAAFLSWKEFIEWLGDNIYEHTS
jgi:hypothetical protein